jgi:hypothetical protein
LALANYFPIRQELNQKKIYKMNKILLPMLSLVLCAGFNAKAQTKPAAPAAEQKVPGPRFKFIEETHDFGTIPRGPIAMYSFEFTNTGDQPLIIMDVKPSCGCTNVEWPKQPVLPGQKGTIQLGLKTIEQHGVFHKEVYVRSNAYNPKGEKMYTLYIKGNAVGDDKDKK